MASGSESEDYDLYESSSSSTDDDIMDLEDETQMLFQFSGAASSSTQLFQSQELSNEGFGLVNHAEGVRDALNALRSTPSLFRMNTNFSTTEFEELCGALVPVIISNSRSTGSMRLHPGRPSKLSPEQRILNFLLYLKHDNIAALDTFTWNWAKTSVLDDTLYIASCINEALRDELRWPSAYERVMAGRHMSEFPGCIGIIDGTLIRIRKPWNDPNHGRYFNGRKKMYCLNSLVVVDHQGLFIYIEPGFPGAYHDINVLRHSDLNASWRDYFTHTDEYFEYLLGDPGYQGREAFIMRRVADREVAPDQEDSAIAAYNRMHAGYRVRVEWGIGGLKMKWRRFTKRFDSSKPKFRHLFCSSAILTNFLHRRRLDLSYEVIGGRVEEEGMHGWHGDF